MLAGAGLTSLEDVADDVAADDGEEDEEEEDCIGAEGGTGETFGGSERSVSVETGIRDEFAYEGLPRGPCRSDGVVLEASIVVDKVDGCRRYVGQRDNGRERLFW